VSKEEEIKKLRSKKARELNIGQFKLFTDAQLKELCAKKFKNVNELFEFFKKAGIDISEDVVYEIAALLGLDVTKSKLHKPKKSSEENKPKKKDSKVKSASDKKPHKKGPSSNNILKDTVEKEHIEIEFQTKEYNFPKIEEIYSGNIIHDTFKSKYYTISSSIFFLRTWWRLRKNKELFEKLEDSLFGKLEGSYVLTEQQKLATLSDEQKNLVVSGAGTGKTSLMLAKTGYLLLRDKIETEDILLLAYNKDAASQLRGRGRELLGSKLNARTFHSFGNEITDIQKGDRDLDQVNKKIWIQNKIDKLPKNHSIHQKLIYYFANYLVPPPNVKKIYKSLNEYSSYLKSVRKVTLNQDQVKSWGEYAISNFLFVHGVKYEYEKKWPNQSFGNYHPDFTVFKESDPDNPIIIEYFGIDREGNVKPGIVKDLYNKQIQQKRDFHEKVKTDYIELFYYEIIEGNLIKKLESELLKRGVVLDKKSDEDLIEIFKEKEYYTHFAKLAAEFLEQFKSNQHSLKTLYEESKDPRTTSFLNIFEWLYSEYENYLYKEEKKDFADMVNDATEALMNDSFITNFKWIIVDEFQDISAGRLRMIMELLRQSPKAKLMVVGDDWQSIYRFAGSDISLVTRFEKYFGRSVQFELTKSFRFNDHIKELSQIFIQQNKLQKKKTITVENEVGHHQIFIHWSSDQLMAPSKYKQISGKQRFEKIKEVVTSLKKEDIYKDMLTNGSLLIIGRYKHDLPDGGNKDGPQREELQEIWGIDNELEILTVHRSKGLEYDYVLIVDMINGHYGFPSGQETDELMNLVLAPLGEADLLMKGEERRLFYVAMTRAKNQVHIISETPQPSEFIDEISTYTYKSNNLVSICLCCEDSAPIKCNNCDGSGNLRKQTHNKDGKLLSKPFYGCSNHPICNERKEACPICEKILVISGSMLSCSSSECSGSIRKCTEYKCDGLLQRRVGNDRNIAFWGCSNYYETKCEYYEKYTKNNEEDCPTGCGGKIFRGKTMQFWGCRNYFDEKIKCKWRQS